MLRRGALSMVVEKERGVVSRLSRTDRHHAHVSWRQPAFRGYTLLELMVTLAVLAILATLTVPGFQDTIRRTARDSSMQDLSTALDFARAQAVTEGTRVSLCRSTDLGSCSGGGGGDWSAGWIVFTDRGTAGTVDGDDTVLQAQEAKQHDWEIELVDSSGGNVTGDYLRYTPDGFLADNDDTYFRFCEIDGVADSVRALLILGTGRVAASRDDGDGVHNDLSGTNLSCI